MIFAAYFTFVNLSSNVTNYYFDVSDYIIESWALKLALKYFK